MSVVERCYPHRVFDASGRLLYVGITRETTTRFADHRRRAPWWSEVTRCEYRVLPDRGAAEAAEVLAILTERPIHNAARPTPEAVEKMRARSSRDETAKQPGVVAEVEWLRRLAGEQHVRVVRLECDNGALAQLVDEQHERLRWAQADARQSDALVARLTAECGRGRAAVAR